MRGGSTGFESSNHPTMLKKMMTIVSQEPSACHQHNRGSKKLCTWERLLEAQAESQEYLSIRIASRPADAFACEALIHFTPFIPKTPGFVSPEPTIAVLGCYDVLCWNWSSRSWNLYRISRTWRWVGGTLAELPHRSNLLWAEVMRWRP